MPLTKFRLGDVLLQELSITRKNTISAEEMGKPNQVTILDTKGGMIIRKRSARSRVEVISRQIKFAHIKELLNLKKLALNEAYAFKRQLAKIGFTQKVNEVMDGYRAENNGDLGGRDSYYLDSAIKVALNTMGDDRYIVRDLLNNIKEANKTALSLQQRHDDRMNSLQGRPQVVIK